MSRSSSKSSLKEEEDWDELTSGATRRAMTDQVVVDLLFDSSVDGPGEFIDHRTLPRRERKKYDHARAKECIMSDYLGLAPLFNDRQFQVFFRISRSRMQCFIEDFGGTGDKYYCGKGGSCLEARILLPLKTLAYGVPPHTFCDYFQMSFQFARDCCDKFDSTLSAIYKAEYLRLPTRSDVKNITKCHKATHGIDGMFGSLDCMHTIWKNCPVGWQGSYLGAKGKPTIVLEAICDQQLFFWHASYGYVGTLNDKTILEISPFLESLVDGSFEANEVTAVPFKIANQQFHRTYVLVDGIYPPLARFVKGITEPVGSGERTFTKWQESARKDIERAFGVLQGKFQYTHRPLMEMKLEKIGKRVTTCILLHNMCASDRVMEGACRARYNPCNSIIDEGEIAIPSDRAGLQGASQADDLSRIGFEGRSNVEIHNISRREKWAAVKKHSESRGVETASTSSSLLLHQMMT